MRLGVSLLGLTEGKSLEIETESQNKLNAIKYREIWRKF